MKSLEVLSAGWVRLGRIGAVRGLSRADFLVDLCLLVWPAYRRSILAAEFFLSVSAFGQLVASVSEIVAIFELAAPPGRDCVHTLTENPLVQSGYLVCWRIGTTLGATDFRLRSMAISVGFKSVWLLTCCWVVLDSPFGESTGGWILRRIGYHP